MAALAVTLPCLTPTQLADFFSDVGYRFLNLAGKTVAGCAVRTWEDETARQAESDPRQAQAVFAIERGNAQPHEIEPGERATYREIEAKVALLTTLRHHRIRAEQRQRSSTSVLSSGGLRA